jgi:tripeptide aminopeptidase
MMIGRTRGVRITREDRMALTAERFKELVPIDNPSGDEGRIREVIRTTLADLDYTDAQVDDAGNLFVRIPGDASKETILLSAHMDSVPPCHGIEPIDDVHDGRPIIRSAGKTILGADDKSGIATILRLMERLKESGSNTNHPLELLFSTQEEVGLLGLKAFDLTQCKATMGFVLDGEGSIGDIFCAGPSQENLLFELEGIRSHAGIAPDAGVSAIDMAVHLCASLPSGRLSSETTMNIGVIAGGDAMNIVAPSAVIRGEARSHDETALENLITQIREVCHEIQEHFPRGKVSFTPTHKYSRFFIAPDHPVIKTAEASCRKLGIEPRVLPMNIGSDAHVLNHSGLPCAVLGMGFHFSHSLGEFIYVDELEQVTQLVWDILEN